MSTYPTEVAGDVDVANEDTFTLLKKGQQVETPLGPGVIVDIEIQAGRYGKRVEIEPPAVTVKLDDPEEGDPDRIVVCMCKLGLEDDEHEAIIKKEFSRLWPPLTEDVPEDTHMLVNVHKEGALVEFQGIVNQIISAQIEGANCEKLHRDAFRRYADLSEFFVDPVTDDDAGLSPGMVLNNLEGLDLEDGKAIVLKMNEIEDEEGGSETQAVIYLTGPEKVKVVRLPQEVQFDGHDGGEAVGITPTVYDPLRVDSPELHQIRILPDSFLPKNPNYPSSLTNTIWRPTVRQTPIRFYSVDDTMSKKDKQTREAGGFEHKPEQPPLGGHYWPPKDYTNYPTPDTVLPPEQMPEIWRGPLLYMRPEEQESIPPMDPVMEQAALMFWNDYQDWRNTYIPGKRSREDETVENFMDIWRHNVGLDENEMLEFLGYMTHIVGMFPRSVYDTYADHLGRMKQSVMYRTHYPDI